MGKQSARRKTICPDGPDSLADCYLHHLSGCIPCGIYVLEHDKLGRDGYTPPEQPPRPSLAWRIAVVVTMVAVLWMVVTALLWTAALLISLAVS